MRLCAGFDRRGNGGVLRVKKDHLPRRERLASARAISPGCGRGLSGRFTVLVSPVRLSADSRPQERIGSPGERLRALALISGRPAPSPSPNRPDRNEGPARHGKS
jgi:hypothetical protein